MLFETKEKAQNEWEALMFIKELIFGLNQKNITQSINLITKFDKTYSLSFNMIVSQLIYQVLVIKMNDYDLYLNFIKEIEVFEENNQTKSKILDVFTKHLLSKVTCDSSYLLNKMIENNFVSPKIVQKCISSCFAHYMTKEEIEKYNKIRFMKKIIENYEELSKNDWELHKKYVKEGVNPNEIAKIIRNDDIKKLQEISSQTNFNIDQIIEPSPYERCNFINEDLHLMYDDFTLIDYAAFFGSVKCFKYLLVNGADVYNTGRCAVAGGNLEIIHLCEKNHSSFVGAYETAIMFHRNDIFKYIYEKKLEIKYYKLEELAIFCILYHNYEIFLFLIENGMKINNNIINESAKNGNMLLTLYLIKKNFIPKDILVYSSKSGNIELMKYFLGKEGINVNTHCDEIVLFYLKFFLLI